MAVVGMPVPVTVPRPPVIAVPVTAVMAVTMTAIVPVVAVVTVPLRLRDVTCTDEGYGRPEREQELNRSHHLKVLNCLNADAEVATA